MTTFDSGVYYLSNGSDSVTINTGFGGSVSFTPYDLLDAGTVTLPGAAADWTVTGLSDGMASLTTSLPGPLTLTEITHNGFEQFQGDFSSSSPLLLRVQSDTVLDFLIRQCSLKIPTTRTLPGSTRRRLGVLLMLGASQVGRLLITTCPLPRRPVVSTSPSRKRKTAQACRLPPRVPELDRVSSEVRKPERCSVYNAAVRQCAR